VITLLAHFFLNEKAQLFEIAALVISFIGIVIIGMAHPKSAADENKHFIYDMGLALAVFAAISLALATILSRKLKVMDTSALLFVHMLFGTALAGTLMYFETKETPFFVYESNNTYIILIVGCVANIFAMQMWQYSVQNCKST